jgi:hypothetical protein
MSRRLNIALAVLSLAGLALSSLDNPEIERNFDTEQPKPVSTERMYALVLTKDAVEYVVDRNMTVSDCFDAMAKSPYTSCELQAPNVQ